MHVCGTDKSEPLDAESAEKIRTDENSCNEICRYGRKIEKLCGS
jgi:hypothetical protein